MTSPSSPLPSTPGAGTLLLDKYELVRPIGEGGMGVVWIAHNRVLDVAVAVKLVHPGNGPSSNRSAQRVLNEARLAAQLEHRAICRVLDYGTTPDGDPFVVSELLHGENLAEALARKQRLSSVRAVQTLLPILDGLSAAHAKNIVHRDVKPANVFLARENDGRVQPKLLDFGIARLLGPAPEQAALPALLGTPCYMSPEQARGANEVDFRSDLWSFCVSLYELVTGVVPFIGADHLETLAEVQTREPAPITQHAAGDVRLSQIVARGLQKEPGERWGSASELARELSLWLLSHGEEADVYGQALRTRIGDSAPAAILTPAFGRPLAELLEEQGLRPAQATTVIRARATALVPTLAPALIPARAAASWRPFGASGAATLSVAAALSLLGGGAWFASEPPRAAAPAGAAAPAAFAEQGALLAPAASREPLPALASASPPRSAPSAAPAARSRSMQRVEARRVGRVAGVASPSASAAAQRRAP